MTCRAKPCDFREDDLLLYDDQQYTAWIVGEPVEVRQ